MRKASKLKQDYFFILFFLKKKRDFLQVTSTRHSPPRPAEEIEMAPGDSVLSVSVSVPLQNPDSGDALAEEDALAGHHDSR